LTWLGLDCNNISDVGARALAEAVGAHDKLYWFSMDDNLVSDDAGVKIGKSLQKHKELNFLWLTNNLLGDAGAASLANNVGTHQDLKWLGLNDNDDIGKSGTAQLMEEVPPAKGIEWLQLKGRIRGPDWRVPDRHDVDMLELLAAEREKIEPNFRLRNPRKQELQHHFQGHASLDRWLGAGLDFSSPSKERASPSKDRAAKLSGFAAGEAVKADSTPIRQVSH
jgi:hypothetical protein